MLWLLGILINYNLDTELVEMDEIKELLVRQNQLLELQNEILKKGFSTLIRTLVFPNNKSERIEDLRDFLTFLKENK